jgi:fluoride ion exporter CrcB/FEX
MNQLSTFIAELQTLLPDNPPYLVTAYQIMLVVAGFFVAWIILRWLLHFVEKRISRYEFYHPFHH